jgi:hypothetical protein
VNRKQQGDLGVAMAVAYYTAAGAGVSVPMTDNLRYDLVIDRDGRLRRVQVKTTGYQRFGRYEVSLRTSGGNRSGMGAVKYLTAEECDLVFVYALNGDMWEFPAEVVSGSGMLNLGQSLAAYRIGALAVQSPTILPS